MEAIISFESVSHAVRGEKTLLETGFPVTVMPLPSSVRAGCGLCLRLPPGRPEEAAACLDKAGIRYSGLFMRKDGEITRIEEGESGS